MNEEEKKAIERFSKAFEYLNVWNKELIVVPEDKKYFLTVLNLLEKKDKQLKGLEEIDKRRTWTVNKVISEYIPDYEIISLINRYKDESFIPRVEVEKILNDRKK